MSAHASVAMPMLLAALGAWLIVASHALGDPGEQSVEAHVARIHQLAAGGDLDATFHSGMCAYSGSGVPRNFEIALAAFRQAAAGGNVPAFRMAAQMYLRGEGAAVDVEEAKALYRKGSEAGDVVCSHMLGNLLYFDSSEQSDRDAAIEEWKSAASRGFRPSIRSLARASLACAKLESGFDVAVYWAQRSGDAELLSATIAFLNHEQLAASTSSWWYINQVAKDDAWGREHAGVTAKHLKELVASATSTGSGFMVDVDAVLTSAHVVHAAREVFVVVQGRLCLAEVMACDLGVDIAVLRLYGEGSSIDLAEADARFGEEVMTIGFPNVQMQGFAPKLTSGRISALSGLGDSPNEYQISVPLQPGNSGGPLVDSLGRVVGVVNARLDDAAALRTTGALPQNVCFATKASAVRRCLNGRLSQFLGDRSSVRQLDLERISNGCVLVIVVDGK